MRAERGEFFVVAGETAAEEEGGHGCGAGEGGVGEDKGFEESKGAVGVSTGVAIGVGF